MVLFPNLCGYRACCVVRVSDLTKSAFSRKASRCRGGGGGEYFGEVGISQAAKLTSSSDPPRSRLPSFTLHHPFTSVVLLARLLLSRKDYSRPICHGIIPPDWHPGIMSVAQMGTSKSHLIGRVFHYNNKIPVPLRFHRRRTGRHRRRRLETQKLDTVV